MRLFIIFLKGGLLMAHGLTPMQKRFCKEYLISGNATQSAIKAGYSSKIAAKAGCDNLKKKAVMDYLQLLREAEADNFNIEVSEIIQMLLDMVHNPDTTDKNKLTALDMILRSKGAYLQRSETTINTPDTIRITIDGDVDATD